MSDKGDTPGFWSVKKVRGLSVSLLIVVLAFKLAFAEFKFDMSSFNFSDFLSLILAISAVGLSAAFYFKADESARQFYNNSYNFTKDIATILGRIEVGFGEKLSTLNKGYDDINRRLGQSTAQHVQEDMLEGKISSVESRLKSSIHEMFDALPKAGAEAETAQKLRSEVEGAAIELDELRAKQSAMERLKDYHPRFTELMRRVAKVSAANFSAELSDDHLINLFRLISDSPDFQVDEWTYMRSHSLVDGDDELTRKGIRFLRDIMASL